MARWIVIAIAAAILVGIVFVALQLRPSKVIAKKQADFIAAIEKRNSARIGRFLAEGYSDRWGFDRDKAVVAIADVASPFMALSLTEEDQTMTIDGGEAEVSVRLTASGTPIGPLGGEVVRRMNRLQSPFVFTWEKQSALPMSWRIVRMDNEEIPTDVYGYTPGDIRRVMRGE